MAAQLVAGDVEVASVVTNDDVAVQDSLYTAGRRGVGVTVLVEKIAGALADLLRDEGERVRLRAAGFERAKRFTWDETARQTVEVYREVGSGR